jgi:hypothetical protein
MSASRSSGSGSTGDLPSGAPAHGRPRLRRCLSRSSQSSTAQHLFRIFATSRTLGFVRRVPGSFVDSVGSFVASWVRSRVHSQVPGPKTRIRCAITNAYGAYSGAFWAPPGAYSGAWLTPMRRYTRHRTGPCAARCATTRQLVCIPMSWHNGCLCWQARRRNAARGLQPAGGRCIWTRRGDAVVCAPRPGAPRAVRQPDRLQQLRRACLGRFTCNATLQPFGRAT